MAEEVLSIAFVRPFEGHDEEVVALASELYVLMKRKQYSRNLLYRDQRDPHLLVNLRYWRSEETRREAYEDPDVQRFWARLGQICRVETVYEQLEEMDWRTDQKA
jgi:quinol monooxygenase YgiN